MAESLALPLLIQPDGLLRRQDRADAVAKLIGVMSSTQRSFWPHAPWFGMLELFLEAKTDVSELPRITEAINVALRELGAEGVTVLSVRNAPGQYGDRRFEISISEDGGIPSVRQVQA
jgi:hypothetical protein